MQRVILAVMVAVLAVIGVVQAQDLDSPQRGVTQNVGQPATGNLFDQLMAKLSQQQAEIEANHVTAWAFDTRNNQLLHQ